MTHRAIKQLAPYMEPSMQLEQLSKIIQILKTFWIIKEHNKLTKNQLTPLEKLMSCLLLKNLRMDLTHLKMAYKQLQMLLLSLAV